MLWMIALGLLLGFLLIFLIVSYSRQKSNVAESSISLRANLSESEAVAIYQRKLDLMNTFSSEPRRLMLINLKNESVALAKAYRVSPKTITDVWNRKTWIIATSHLWEPEW